MSIIVCCLAPQSQAGDFFIYAREMGIGPGRYKNGSVTHNSVDVIQTQEVGYADPTFIQAYVKPAFELEFLTSVRKKGILHVKFTILRTVAALGRCSLALVAIVTVLF
jgi:hypothetical protein